MSLEHALKRDRRSNSTSRRSLAGDLSNDLAPALLTDLEAARLLSCSRATVWRRVKDGTLPEPIRIGGLSRFVKNEVEAVIERAMAARSADDV